MALARSSSASHSLSEGHAADLSRIVLVQEHARADRLHVVSLYNRSFLAVVHIVSPDGMDTCRQMSVLCKPYQKPNYKAVPNFNKPAAEIMLALAPVVEAPTNGWLKNVLARGEPRSRRPPQFSHVCKVNRHGGAACEWFHQLVQRASAARLAQCTGVLVAHMDFWMDPARFGRGLDSAKVWRLGDGLVVPNHRTARFDVVVIAEGVDVTANASGGSRRTRRLPRGHVETVTAQWAGIAGLESKGKAFPDLAIGSQLRVTLDDGWVSQPLWPGPNATSDFALKGLFYRQHCMHKPSEIEADQTYGWGWKSKTSSLSAAFHLRKLNVSEYPGRPLNMSDTHTLVCAGWSDLYYVPVGRLASFITVMHNYLSHHVFHEVAVPTVLHLLTNSDHNLEEVISNCFGCCCCHPAADVDPVDLLAQFECGHRVLLQNNRSSAGLARLLRGQPVLDPALTHMQMGSAIEVNQLTSDQKLVRRGQMKRVASHGRLKARRQPASRR